MAHQERSVEWLWTCEVSAAGATGVALTTAAIIAVALGGPLSADQAGWHRRPNLPAPHNFADSGTCSDSAISSVQISRARKCDARHADQPGQECEAARPAPYRTGQIGLARSGALIRRDYVIAHQGAEATSATNWTGRGVPNPVVISQPDRVGMPATGPELTVPSALK